MSSQTKDLLRLLLGLGMTVITTIVRLREQRPTLTPIAPGVDLIDSRH